MDFSSAATVITRSPKKPKKPQISDDEEDFINNDAVDDEDDEDFGDDEIVSKKRRGAGAKRAPAPAGRATTRGKRARQVDSDDEGAPKRRPRAASLKKPKYSKFVNK